MSAEEADCFVAACGKILTTNKVAPVFPLRLRLALHLLLHSFPKAIYFSYGYWV